MANLDETMMFKVGSEENKAERILLESCISMREKGYNPINQFVGYLLSGDPAYITSYKDARSKVRSIDRDELLAELVKFYLDKNKL